MPCPAPATVFLAMCLVRSITFIPVTPQSLLLAEKNSKGGGNVRDRLRDELRAGMGGSLRHIAGDPDARMSYCTSGYAGLVRRHRLKLVGWPSHIPFTNFSDIRGGVKPIKTLHTAWREGVLKFAPATPEDVANAERDPLSVHPNPELIEHDDSNSDSDSGAGRGGVVDALAHHPGSLDVLGVHPTSTQPSIYLKDRPHDQRADVKRPHRRGGEERPLKRARRARDGVKSSRYVLESDGEDDVGRPAAKREITFWMVNDPLEEFRPVALSQVEQIEAFSDSDDASECDEIESASGWSTTKTLSDIED